MAALDRLRDLLNDAYVPYEGLSVDDAVDVIRNNPDALGYRQVGWITADPDAEHFGGVMHDDETHQKRRLPTCFVRQGEACKPIYVREG